MILILLLIVTRKCFLALLQSVTKLSLFIYCFSLRKQSSQVEVLFEDHRNDLFV